MPEGDTLHRTAHTLHRVLAQQRLVRVRSSIPAIAEAELAGHVVEEVSALGKNLLIRFDDGRVLHTHLKMLGSWHVYRPHERWKRPERVVELAAVAVAARPGFDSDAVDDVLGRLGAADGAARIEMPPVGISSTLVRERVAAGRPIRWMVPDAVARLIAERGLYGAAA